jgi:TRAP-type mannitol/chloroaromatic compound transport system permease large subunit
MACAQSTASPSSAVAVTLQTAYLSPPVEMSAYYLKQ